MKWYPTTGESEVVCCHCGGTFALAECLQRPAGRGRALVCSTRCAEAYDAEHPEMQPDDSRSDYCVLCGGNHPDGQGTPGYSCAR